MKKTRKILSLLLVAVLLSTGGAFADDADGSLEMRTGNMKFNDVPVTAWYCAEVSYAYSMGLVNGMSDTQFMPTRTVTRGQFITMLGRMLMPEGYKPGDQTPRFEDVKAGSYYEIYVLWAAEKGVVNGISETSFGPDREIRRQDMATMIYRAQKLNLTSMLTYSASAVTFADAAQISAYAKDAISSLQQQGLLKGDTKNNVNPLKSLTRAESAAVIARLHAGVNGHVHSYTAAAAVAATCTKIGYVPYYCICGSYYGAKTANALGHNYDTPKFDDVARRYVYTCKRCGYVAYKDLTPQQLYAGNALLQYDELVSKLSKLRELYPDILTVGSAGSSVKGVDIPLVKLGKGSRYILLNGNLHAREYITANYLLDVIDEYCYAYARSESLGGYPIRSLLSTFTLVIIPCLNPDGRALAIGGDVYRKTNANGVDLNANFPTNWVYKADGSAGGSAGSEAETKALIGVLNQYKFELVIDCHTAGNVIYYADDDCSEAMVNRSYQLGQALSAASGFGLYKYPATPGMANYARHPYGCMGFTVEMWPTLEHPIDCSGYYEQVWNKLSTMPAIAMTWLKNNP